MGLFGSAPHPPSNPGSSYVSTLTNIGTGLGNLYGSTLAPQFQRSNDQEQDAARAYSNFLTTPPGSQQQNGQYVAQAERGASEGAQRAAANLDQNLAMRGISPNSAAGIGGLANIQTGLAANDANIQAQRAADNERQYQANLAANAGLWSNEANNDFSRGQGVIGAQANIDSGLLNNATQVAEDNYAQQVSAYNSQNAFLGSVAGAAGAASKYGW